eukprot:COSAG02_NODE_5939_length_3927_cov_2.253135_2_plen_99_part_00
MITWVPCYHLRAVIQRLGSDALLIGSRRRMGAAPVVVGGADPIAANVTTTAGLGDGVHDLRTVSFFHMEIVYECSAWCCRNCGTGCIANLDRGATSLD